MAIQSYKDLKEYLVGIMLSMPELKSFTRSDDERVLSRQAADWEYPMLQLDPPTFTPELIRYGAHRKQYNCTIAILKYVEADDWTAQEQAIEELEPLLHKLISKLEKDKVLEVLGDAYQIARATHDNTWGWAIELSVKESVSYCYSTGDWYELRHYTPAFEEEQTLIKIEVNGESYEVAWEDEADVQTMLDAMVAAINADTGTTNAKAWTQQTELTSPHLIITATTTAATLTIDTPSEGHNWTLVNSMHSAS